MSLYACSSSHASAVKISYIHTDTKFWTDVKPADLCTMAFELQFFLERKGALRIKKAVIFAAFDK